MSKFSTSNSIKKNTCAFCPKILLFLSVNISRNQDVPRTCAHWRKQCFNKCTSWRRERCSQREEAFYIQSIHSVAKADEMTEQTLFFWKGNSERAQGSSCKMKCLKWLQRSKCLFLEKSSYVTKGKSKIPSQDWKVWRVLWGGKFMMTIWIRKTHVWSEFFLMVITFFSTLAKLLFPPLYFQKT